MNVFITLFFGSVVDLSSESGALLKEDLVEFFPSSGLIIVSFPICKSTGAVISLKLTRLPRARSTPDWVPGSRISLVCVGGRA